MEQTKKDVVCTTEYFVSYNAGDGWKTTEHRDSKRAAAADWWKLYSECQMDRFQATMCTVRSYRSAK